MRYCYIFFRHGYSYYAGPATGDGKPTCFSCVKDTEIPALKDWCHAQTFPFRKAAVIAFLNDIQTLLVSISSYFSDVDQAAVEDQQALRRQWESLPSECRRGRAQGTGRRTGGVSGHLDQVCVATWHKSHIYKWFHRNCQTSSRQQCSSCSDDSEMHLRTIVPKVLLL